MNRLGRIRNFSIIAHIDHGKTTLTDRFLEITKTIEQRLMHERFLDAHPISQERGVTIKLAPVRMDYSLLTTHYILNLIDTPGHIDFSYEVSRSLMCCEGAILLVDATQGIQAQTLAHFRLAQKLGLKIIPAINKIDLTNASLKRVAQELITAFGFEENEIYFVSGKTGENVDQLLQGVVEKIPPPSYGVDKPLRILVFDSFYHPHKGVIVYVKVVDGELDWIKEKGKLQFMGTKAEFEPLEIGFLKPNLLPTQKLETGEIGYLATGLKDISLCQVGDTITKLQVKSEELKIVPLPGYQQPKPVVFFDFYPVENKDYFLLEEAVKELKLNDFSLFFTPTGSPALGKGLRMGFLGVFHALITQERLERDFDLELVITSPSVEYEIEMKSGQSLKIKHASELPESGLVNNIKEPWVKLAIFCPGTYLGKVFEICKQHRGKFLDQQFFGTLVSLDYGMPLVELISGFYDELKSASSGFASLDYQFWEHRSFKAIKLDVLIHHTKVEALSMIVSYEKGEYLARILAKKLKKVIPKQMFEVAIQVTLDDRIAARETLSAFRKDVTAKLYGGDQTRKDKLLKKQKKGKKRMKLIGKVAIPQEAFMAVLEI